MILNKIKHKIFLNAGHFDIEDTPHIEDPGASIQLEDALFIEALEVMAIRDLVLPLLEQQGFEVVKIPDYLNLADSIALVNEKTSNINDGLCLDLQFYVGQVDPVREGLHLEAPRQRRTRSGRRGRFLRFPPL